MAQITAQNPTRLAALLVPPLAWMAVIFVLSGQASDDVDRAWWDVAARKVAHVTEYAVLTALWWRALQALGVEPAAGRRRRDRAALRRVGRVPPDLRGRPPRARRSTC